MVPVWRMRGGSILVNKGFVRGCDPVRGCGICCSALVWLILDIVLVSFSCLASRVTTQPCSIILFLCLFEHLHVA